MSNKDSETNNRNLDLDLDLDDDSNAPTDEAVSGNAGPQPDPNNLNETAESPSVHENPSSLIVIVASANNSQASSDVSQTSPRLSRGGIRPPEYATIMSMLQSNLNIPKYVQTGPQSTEVEIRITPPAGPTTIIQGPPPLEGAPPSYSAIMRIGPPEPSSARGRRVVSMQPSPPFIAPHPPPSYAETCGIYNRSTPAVEEYVWGTEPFNVVCPSCSRMVTTTTQRHRSSLTHFSACVLCICGCWPFCLLPYCMKSCKTTYHYCPECQTYLGMYTPW